VLPPSHPIGPDDLEGCLKHQRIDVRIGDVVLVRTGQMRLWPDLAFVSNTPGLNRAGAEFLAKSGAIMIGADNLALEQTPSAEPLNFFPVHTYTARLGERLREDGYTRDRCCTPAAA
jgi:kynurenine formamidase